MADDCQICRKTVLDNDEALLCDRCEKWCHRNCLNMSKTSFKKHEKSKSEWLCPKCLGNNSRDIINNQTKKDAYTIGDIMEKLTEMDKKYTKLLERYEEQTIINRELREELQLIKRTLNTREQHELNNNIVIQGVPRKENEKVEEIVEKIAKTLNVINNADKMYRLGSGSGNTAAPIKVIFKNADDKKKWMLAKKSKEVTTAVFGLNNNPTPIYINHDLTKQNLILFKAAKQFKKDNNYKYVWINNGKILLRQTDTSKTILIEDESDLKN